MKKVFTHKEAEQELKKGYEKAEEILNDKSKMEEFLQRLEKKLESIPVAGEKLAYIPVFASLLNSYVKKEYTDIPIGTIIAIISALLYFVSPLDVIPDVIPGIGHIDDATVALACLKLVETDIETYDEWRIKNGKK